MFLRSYLVNYAAAFTGELILVNNNYIGDHPVNYFLNDDLKLIVWSAFYLT